jgi:hypothetical protein
MESDAMIESRYNAAMSEKKLTALLNRGPVRTFFMPDSQA